MRCTNLTGLSGGLIVHAQRRTKGVKSSHVEQALTREELEKVWITGFFCLGRSSVSASATSFCRRSPATTSFSYLKPSLRLGPFLHLTVRPLHIKRTLNDILPCRVQEVAHDKLNGRCGLSGRTSSERFSLVGSHNQSASYFTS